MGLGQLASAIVAAFTVADIWHHFRDQLHTIDNNPDAQVHLSFGPIWGLDLIGLATLIPEIFFIVWLYQAAGVARNLQLPARRSQAWAILGFIVPIVNFWFPYQVAADLFPPGSADRALAGHWWGWWLGQAGVGALVAAVSFASTPAAVAVALVGSVVNLQMMRYGRRMIATATAMHRDLAGHRG
jgi:hypothetical protein